MYTYTPKNEKLPTVLIKGLDNSFEGNEILEELKLKENKDLYTIHFIKVTRFVTKHSKITNKTLSLFLVQLSPNSKLDKLKELQHIGHLIISWEKIRKKESIQCKKCQRLGHTASNCNMEYRCVKCKDPHKPGECKLKREEKVDKQKIYCVNCDNYGQPASYIGCPKLLAIKNLQEQRKIEQQDRLNRKI